MEKVSVGQRVYYLHHTRGWSLGKLLTMNVPERRAEIEDEQTGQTEKISLPSNNSAPSPLHTYIDNSYDAKDPELFRVGDLHVATLLHCIKERCELLRLQYSRMGEMVLSVNPFQAMPFNGEQECERYLQSTDPQSGLPPHVWQIAHKAFTQIIVRGLGNQSVVISGESGSGKTENTKMLISFLGKMSFKHSCNAAQRDVADRVNRQLKWSNPILETLGNARTVRNDNSSRFGKYTKLYFDPLSGVMVGGEMVTYLLEKSRIVSVSQGERNYHVFYEMLAGLSAEEKQKLGGLKTAHDYPSLSRGDTFLRRGVDGRDVDDSREFQNLREAFSELGVDKDTQWSIFSVLAAILHLQELTFESDDNDKAKIVDPVPLNTACSLLGIESKLLVPCFLEKSKTKILTLLATKTEAAVLRDAFCKALYVGLFDTLVAHINSAIRPPKASSRYIGVLDIFGFENFTKNSFEQLCINFANETLQNHYNKYTFLNDEAECKEEGIAMPRVEFPDNKVCLELFTTSKTGIFGLLDEECSVKTGAAKNFTTNVWNYWTGKNDYFIRPKTTIPTEFGVKHYASAVTYNTEEWLEKNADALKEEAKQCVMGSTNPYIAKLLDGIETVSSDGQMKKRVTVSSRFQIQLQHLRSELESTETHFIRCVKPNMLAQPAMMENAYVGAQLESAGVLQTIALKRQGYPVRRPLTSFSAFFYIIAPRGAASMHRQKNYKESSKAILSHYCSLYNWREPHYAVGVNKVFLRAHVWSTLERLLLRKKLYYLRKAAPILKRWVAEFRQRKLAERRRQEEEQRRIQEQARLREEQQKKAAEAARKLMLDVDQAEKDDLVRTAKRSGLDDTKSEWFCECALLFRYFDLPIILDVVYNLSQKEQAFAALTDMQKERLEVALPVSFRNLFQELNIRMEIAETLASRGVTSLASIAQLTRPELIKCGLNETELEALQGRMLSQQSNVMVTERLRDGLGGGGCSHLDLEKILKDARAAASRGAPTDQEEFKLQSLGKMGFTRQQSLDALQKNNGDLEKAGEWLLKAKEDGELEEEDPGKVQQLVAMGFDAPSASSALKRTKSNMQSALNLLLGGV